MPTKTIVFGLAIFLHDLFTAAWIGGLITLGLTVMPSLKNVLEKGPQMKKIMEVIQKRHSLFVHISIIGLVVTGLLQANHNTAYLGFFNFGNAYSAVLAVKHILVMMMVVITLYRSLALAKISTPKQEKLKAKLLMLNIGIGTLVLLASGLASAFSSLPLN